MLAFSEPDEIYIDNDCRFHVEGPVEQLYDLHAERFDVRPLSMEHNVGRADAKLWLGESCGFVAIEDDAALVRRSRKQADHASETMFLTRWVGSAIRGLVDDQTLDYDPRGVFLMDNGVAVSMVQSRNRHEGIEIPKSLLGYDPDQHATLICLSRSPVLKDVLNADLDHIFEGLNGRNVLDRNRVQRVLATVKVAIGSEHQDGDIRRRARDGVADLICRFIEHRLDDPNLSTGLILKNFGVSRASLYRMFEAKGGVRQYISERRVIRAVMELGARPVVRGEISAVAEKWGFASIQRFNRSVRRQFGVAPSALVS